MARNLHGEPIQHAGFTITTELDDDEHKYMAWGRCHDHALIFVGYSICEAAGTHYYDDPDTAVAAAKSAIDKGEWKPHGKSARR